MKEPLSYQEKKNILSLISNILIFAGYYLYVLAQYKQENLNDTNDFSFWGAAILILIPVLVFVKLVIQVIFNTIHRTVTQEKEPAFADEFDKRIEVKAIRNFCFAFVSGFAVSMLSLVLHHPPVVMFKILLFSIIGAGIVIDLSQLYFYRKGI